jgi:purine-binding chemotaxis protein CheW
MPKETETSTELQLVLFDLASEHYAIDSSIVREIIRIQSITRVPGASNYVEGVTNLRGRVVPVLDLRKRLDLPVADRNKETRIVVVNVASHDVGLIVDGVSEVLRIPTSVIEPPAMIVTGEDADYVRGIAKLETKMVILLDLDKLLTPAITQTPVMEAAHR